MTSERATQFASKSPEGWDDNVAAMRATRMFLLQTMGPTRFVVRGEESDRKYTVLIGSLQRCSCGVSLCAHHLFVMIKVLKVPQTSPLAWQTSLIDSEVDNILSGITNASKSVTTPKRKDFLRRGSGRTSATGSGTTHSGDGDGGSENEAGRQGETRRLELVPGEVCPVCQEEMAHLEDGVVVPADDMGNLTFCSDGCGNNMHTRCMLMYAEHRRSSGDKPCCPLCRTDWGITSIRALKEEHRKGCGKGGRGRQNSGATGANDGGTSKKRSAVSITCRSCKVKVQAVFFRCLVCVPAGSWDVCRRCYGSVGSSSTRGGPCPLSGGGRHPFVQAEAASDPCEWKPAPPPDTTQVNRMRGGGTAGNSAAAAGLLSLQGRDITTDDFELLLTLDASVTPPLHEYLLQSLPHHQPTSQQHYEGQPPTTNSLDAMTTTAPLPLPPCSTAEILGEESADRQITTLFPFQHPTFPRYPIPAAPLGDTSSTQVGIPAPPPKSCWCSIDNDDAMNTGESRDDGSADGFQRVESQTRQLTSGKRVYPRGWSRTWSTGADEAKATRRLPCGHHAHEGCLIPIILEGVGRGHPENCSCPLDDTPLFPSLERRLVRGGGDCTSGNKRRRRCESEQARVGTDGSGATGERQRLSTLMIRGDRATTVRCIAGSKHVGASVAKGKALLQRNTFGSGNDYGTSDASGSLEIMLVGSGLGVAVSASASSQKAGAVGATDDSSKQSRSEQLLSGTKVTDKDKKKTSRTLSAPEISSLRRQSRFQGSDGSGNYRSVESATGGHNTQGLSGISLVSEGSTRQSRQYIRHIAGNLQRRRALGLRLFPAFAVRPLIGKADGGDGVTDIHGAGGVAETGSDVTNTSALDVQQDNGSQGDSSAPLLDSLHSAVESTRSLGLSLQSMRITRNNAGNNAGERKTGRGKTMTANADSKVDGITVPNNRRIRGMAPLRLPIVVPTGDLPFLTTGEDGGCDDGVYHNDMDMVGRLEATPLGVNLDYQY